MGADDLAEATADPVPHDGVADRSADRIRDGGLGRVETRQDPDRDGTRAVTAGPGKGTEGLTAADAPDQAESLARP